MYDINIRLLKDIEEDYKLLEKWYQEEEIYLSFEQRKLNYKEIKEKYYPRTLKEAKVPVYMIEYQKKPVGIIQYKLVEDDDKRLYNLTGNNIYEIDIFIGELKEHNKGIGSKAINILSKLLEKEKSAELLVMCPLKSNINAINCYKKCGFYIKDYFDTKDTIGIPQTYALMVKKKKRKHKMGIIYDKWRDLLIDPTNIKYKKIKILEIFSYPYAQNDIVECKCLYDDNIIDAFVKIERSKMADFDAEINTLKILEKDNLYDKMPRVIEDGIINDKHYIVLKKIEGIRLSDIIKNNSKIDKFKYLINYGRELAKIHSIKSELFNNAKQRIINDIPKVENYKEFDNFLKLYIDYLSENRIIFNNKTFIHGDFHYANILWQDEEISGVLDFEYSGMGFKEQDIAWSIVLRPTQTFMDNIEDIKYFLKGYLEVGTYDKNSLKWCMINAYCHFYLMNRENIEYINKLKQLIVVVFSKL